MSRQDAFKLQIDRLRVALSPRALNLRSHERWPLIVCLRQPLVLFLFFIHLVVWRVMILTGVESSPGSKTNQDLQILESGWSTMSPRIKNRLHIPKVQIAPSGGPRRLPEPSNSTKNNFPKIVFAGVVRNVNNGHNKGFLRWYIPKVVGLAREISSEFHIVILENDSVDGTRELLQTFLGNQTYATLLLEDKLDNKLHNRISKLALVRNMVLQHVRKHFDHYDYLIMTDMDGVCGGSNMSLSYDPNIFKYVLQSELRDEWDVLSFRFVPYWDLYAFRHPILNDTIKRHADADKLLFGTNATPWPNGLIPVDSAFMMLSIYRMSVLRNGTAKYESRDEHGDTVCEHVTFHKELRQTMNARVRLSPLVYCVGDPGYRPLTDEILANLSL